VERLASEFELDVEWKPYELHPEIPTEGIEPERLFGSRRRGDDYMGMLREEGESEGLVIRAPRRIANSAVALEATEFARDQGVEAFDCLHHRLFEAYFTDGQNIGEREVLVSLSAQCGLDTAALGEALDKGRYRQRVRDSIEFARRAGITGTPTFIFDDRFALVGAQSYDVFKSVTERILQRRAEGYPEA
jgi:predicted DsbA family dithiol-disulfide isomerase